MTVGDFITIVLLMIAIVGVARGLSKSSNERAEQQGKQEEINKNTEKDIKNLQDDSKAIKEEIREDNRVTRNTLNKVQLDLSEIKTRFDAFINK